MTLADGTIQQTITKDAGHGPYLWAVIWKDKDRPQDDPYIRVYSHFAEAKQGVIDLEANGHSATFNLACDYTRKVQS